MKKKILILALLLILIVSVTGCSQPYNFDLSKYLTLGTYSGIEVLLAETETELEAGIKKLQDDNSTKNDITDRAVKTGDVVNINYVGTLGGVEFSGGSSNNYDLEIGSGTFVDGFEDGIIGKNIGNTCSVVGCNKKKHPKSKYCSYHKKHRPRSADAYQRMTERY
jgi:trigger factor